ncbi:MAG: lipoate--protein ligase [Bacteroidales bacterium]|jgi:lipoate-protein ligase A|nr:lipoate--protein ligase [Bacteroidales bacterium]
MLCIKNPETNPYFNLAAEEYVLKNFKENCFMLWRNRPSIIVGKHQNTLAEINFEFVKQNNIDVVRRLSGGGAVFHDLGNLNFTFIKNANAQKNLVDFKKYTQPVIDVLRQLGVDAKFEGRNDIMIDGRKVSGNAEHVFKRRVLHHGTLLFSSVMLDLSKALKVNPLKYQDKGVKSVRSRVTNISDHLPGQMTVMEFHDKIFDFMVKSEKDAELYEYTADDLAKINQLVDEKYKTWDWNFGYSPKYNYEKLIRTNGGNLEVHLNVDRGIIENLKIYGDFFGEKDIEDIVNLLKHKKHQEEEIRQILEEIDFQKYFHNITIDEFISALF